MFTHTAPALPLLIAGATGTATDILLERIGRSNANSQETTAN